jgi:hypothetical protein
MAIDRASFLLRSFLFRSSLLLPLGPLFEILVHPFSETLCSKDGRSLIPFLLKPFRNAFIDNSVELSLGLFESLAKSTQNLIGAQPREARIRGAQVIAMARPPVVLGLATKTRLNGIEVDVTNELQKILFVINQLGLETSPEKRVRKSSRSLSS